MCSAVDTLHKFYLHRFETSKALQEFTALTTFNLAKIDSSSTASISRKLLLDKAQAFHFHAEAMSQTSTGNIAKCLIAFVEYVNIVRSTFLCSAHPCSPSTTYSRARNQADSQKSDAATSNANAQEED